MTHTRVIAHAIVGVILAASWSPSTTFAQGAGSAPPRDTTGSGRRDTTGSGRRDTLESVMIRATRTPTAPMAARQCARHWCRIPRCGSRWSCRPCQAKRGFGRSAAVSRRRFPRSCFRRHRQQDRHASSPAPLRDKSRRCRGSESRGTVQRARRQCLYRRRRGHR